MFLLLGNLRKSGELVLTREVPPEKIQILVRDGRAVAATLNGHPNPAAPEIIFAGLDWSQGDFEFTPREVDVDDEVGMDMTEILIEGSRKINAVQSPPDEEMMPVNRAGVRSWLGRAHAVCVALALVALPTRAAAAPVGVARANLDIDTTAAGPGAPIIYDRLDELGNRELRRAEILPARGTEDPWIRVVIRTLDGEEPGFKIVSALYVNEALIVDTSHETECRLCTETEAVERAIAEITRLVPYVRDITDELEAAQVGPEPGPGPDVPPPDAQAPGLGGRGKAGVALVVVGGAAAATGLGLGLAPSRPDPEMPMNLLSTRTPGFAVLGAGAALVIVGAVLLGVDRKKAKSSRNAALAPSFNRSTAGVVFSARF